MRFLVSAGEASGDFYASGVTAKLLSKYPEAEWYGCAGPRLQALGVRPIVDAASLGVVGLAEVVGHLPRIYGQYRKLIAYARQQRPDAAILSDNPDFNLRVAAQMKALGVPVYYVVAPQVWAWRQGRVRVIQRVVDRLFCLFPFEEQWFRERGVDATYIGHPLGTNVRPRLSRSDFRTQQEIADDQRLVALLPGSRTGEALRHLPYLLGAALKVRSVIPECTFRLAMPAGYRQTEAYRRFREPLAAQSIEVVEGDTWDTIAHADVALAASGTVTIEAAVLGTPTVTFYRVNRLTWWAGRRLVKVPFLSMVNLIANRQVIPEYIQDDMTPDRLAEAVIRLLKDPQEAAAMRTALGEVRASLTREGDSFERAATLIREDLRQRPTVRRRSGEN